MDKIGGEKLLSIWWFLVLILVGGSIALAVIVYYSAEININDLEAEALGERILNCLRNNENFSVIFNENFDIFQKCRLRKEVFGKGSSFYFKIIISDENAILKEISFGDSSFEENCRIKQKASAKYFPGCYEINENLFFYEKTLKINLLTASNQKGKKIAVV